jgi:biotin operon repressor
MNNGNGYHDEQDVLSSNAEEMALLSCFLIDSKTHKNALESGVTPSYFDNLRNRSNFESISQVLQIGTVPTVESLSLQIGGLERYQELLNCDPFPRQAADIIPKLKDLHDRRRVVMVIRQCEKLARNLKSPVSGLLSGFARELEILTPSSSSLPEIESAISLYEDADNIPAELVKGLLHQSTKFALGGGSKTCKTWVLLDLAISVAAGIPWLGKETIACKVLFANLEIHRPFFRRRIARICKEKEIAVPANLDIWNLRGYNASAEVLLPKITERIKEHGYGMIILDPIYKTYGDLKENAAEDMSKLLNHFERVAFQTNAAIGFAAHFSKGNQAQKDAIDRISGSGVFARDPDTIITMTALEKEGTFAIDANLRNLPPLKPFGVRWKYPLMLRDDELDPSKLKKPGGKPKGYEESKVAAILSERSLSTVSWQKTASQELGVSRSAFYRCIQDLQYNGIAIKSKVDDLWTLVKKGTPIPDSE